MQCVLVWESKREQNETCICMRVRLSERKVESVGVQQRLNRTGSVSLNNETHTTV